MYYNKNSFISASHGVFLRHLAFKKEYPLNWDIRGCGYVKNLSELRKYGCAPGMCIKTFLRYPELLFNLLSQRYKRCSTIVTNNLSFTEWVQAFGEEKLTTLMDWLGYHAHILPTKGVSYRKLKNDRDEIKRF